MRSLIELVKNENFYHNRFAHIVGPVNEAIKNTLNSIKLNDLTKSIPVNDLEHYNQRIEVRHVRH